MKTETPSFYEIRAIGFEALLRELGPAGARVKGADDFCPPKIPVGGKRVGSRHTIRRGVRRKIVKIKISRHNDGRFFS